MEGNNSMLGHHLEGVTRLFREPVVISREDQRFAEVATWADASFFEVLPLPVIAGNPSTALESPDRAVLDLRFRSTMALRND
jgi:putative ABC transport system permease protein